MKWSLLLQVLSWLGVLQAIMAAQVTYNVTDLCQAQHPNDPCCGQSPDGCNDGVLSPVVSVTLAKLIGCMLVCYALGRCTMCTSGAYARDTYVGSTAY